MSTKEHKRIPTFSWLIRKAEQLLRKNPAEYALLRSGSGSTALLKGATIRMELQDVGSVNRFIILSKDKHYAEIFGFRSGKDFYTHYVARFSTTEYRKRLQKYLPFSLPAGVRQSEWTACQYFNADGSFCENGRWLGGRRGRPGSPGNGFMVVRDSDGKFVDPKSDDGSKVVSSISVNAPTDLWHQFLPGTVMSKIEWYSSMVPPQVTQYEGGIKVDQPLWDVAKVKLLAAKVHAEALRVTKKYPHIKAALYPMAPCNKPSSNVHEQPERLFRFAPSHAREAVVVGRDHQSDPYLWHLPELVLYWTEPDTRYNVDVPRYIRVTIPPAGSLSLLRGPENLSPFSATYRWGRTEDSRRYIHDVESGRVASERAVNQLIAVKAGFVGEPNVTTHARRRMMNGKMKWGSHIADKNIHDWSQSQKEIMVSDHSTEASAYAWPEPRAARPEGVFSSIEERELLDSLPLC